MAETRRWHTLLEVSSLFLKLGTISFGGPAAHISLIEQEIVQRRKWLSREHFLDLLAATNLVPGPNATEMAIHISFIRAGWPGLVVGGIAFILPSFLISLVLSWAYVRFGTLPQGSALFYGINPVVIAIILVAIYRLGKTAIKDKKAVVVGVVAFVAALLGVNEVLVLLVAGLAGIFLYTPPNWLRWKPTLTVFLPALPLAAPWPDDRLVKLGLFFLKVGSLLFGSGMVLFAFIQRDVVTRYGWLTQQQLIDAIAVGQMTPGPVLSSATFIGYLVAGWVGAAVATVAVFLPSFVIVTLTGPLIQRLRGSPVAQAFLQGVNTAVVALILAVSVALFRSAIVDVWTALIMGVGLALLLRYRVDTIWLVVSGAAFGYVHYLMVGR